MAKQLSYLVDANVLMEAKRRYYRFALCPGFWECINLHHRRGEIASLDKVKNEIKEGKDDLYQWAKEECPKSFFKATTEPKVQGYYGSLMAWAQSQPQYLPAAVAKFAADADGWLVAYAKHHNYLVVTHETPAPKSKSEIKIPEACKALGVDWVDTFDMLEKLKVQFIRKVTT